MKLNFPFTDNGKSVDNLDALSRWLGTAQGEIEIYFPDGVFYGTLALSDLSCTQLKLYGSGNTRFSGSRPLENIVFEPYGENIITAEIGKGLDFEKLIFDGAHMVLARYPNRDADGTDCYCSVRQAAQRASAWKLTETAYLRSYHNHEWGGNSYKIKGVKNDSFDLEWLGNNNRGSGFSEDKVLVENVLEELDSEGEWFYDKQTGRLYVYGNTCVQAHTISISDRTSIVSVRGCRKTRIEFHAIQFENTDRSLMKLPWHRYLRSDWAFNYGAAFEITDSQQVHIADCTFEHIGGSCILIHNFADAVSVENCDFMNSDSNGVLILGNPDSTYCTSAWENNRHHAEMENEQKTGAQSNRYPRNIQIDRCHFFQLGLEDKQSAGVCVSLTHKVSVTNSTFHCLPRAGVNVCENAFGGFLMENCALFDCVRETGDHGPFNSWGRDRFWSLGGFDTAGKKGLLKKKYVLQDMLEQNILRHNLIVGSKGFGIDLDDGSSNYRIENNVCCGVGIKLREGFFREVRNNLLIHAPIDLHVSYAGNDDRISGNLICNDEPFRLISLNKGHTTAATGNFFVNAYPKYTCTLLKKNRTNQFLSMPVSEILAQKAELPGFEKIDFHFGKEDAPLPDLNTLPQQEKARKRKTVFGTFSALDETIRSRTGAPDFGGVFIEKLTFFGKLKNTKLQQEDLILKINGEKILFQSFTPSMLKKNVCYEIIRNQKNLSL